MGPIFTVMVRGNKDMKHEKTHEWKVDSGNSITFSQIDSGYSLDFASTIHKIQGETLDKIVVDLNYNPKVPRVLSLPALYVVLSRIRMASDLRLLPFIPDLGKDHLYKLSHNPIYSMFMNSFDKNGKFCAKKLNNMINQQKKQQEEKEKQQQKSAETLAPGKIHSFNGSKRGVTLLQKGVDNARKQQKICINNNHINIQDKENQPPS